MQPPSPPQVAVFFLGLLVALAMSVLMAAWIVEQYRQGRDVLPYQPRRPVPWRGIHVVVLVVCFVLAPSVVHVLLEAAHILEWVKGSLTEPTKASVLKQPAGKFFLAKHPGPGSAEMRTADVSLSTSASAPSVDGPAAKSGGSLEQSSAEDVLTEEDMGHQIEQLLRQKGGVWIWFVVVLMALVGAPLVEEWMFRVVLQGWLEKLERGLFRYFRRRHQRQSQAIDAPMATVAGGLQRFAWQARWLGTGPILVTSLLFAGVHFRVGGPPEPADQLLSMLLCQGLGNLLSLLVGVAFLKVACGATAADLGWSWPQAPQDVLKGLAAYVLVIGPIYALMILTKIILILLDWDWMAPDPIPLFFLSGVLGLLYFRSHRLLPSIVLHTAFNATGLAIFWLFS